MVAAAIVVRVTTSVEPGAAHEYPGGGVHVFTVIVAVVLLVRASVEVPDDVPFMYVVTNAEFPVTTPEYVTPAKAGVVRVILKLEPVCVMEYSYTVPLAFAVHVPEKSAGAVD